MKKKKKLSQYLNYLRESKKSILLVITIFIFSIIIGILNADSLANIITPLLHELIDKTENLSTFELISFIFINNSLTSLLGIILGLFFGILPIISTITNGIVLGFVLERTAQFNILELWRLFPHGIFELPAIFISLGLGVKLGHDTLKYFLLRNKKSNSKRILGIFSIFLAIFGISSLRLITTPNQSPSITLTFLVLGLLLITPYLLLFFILNTKIRKYNTAIIKHALKIFFYIIIPLLIIAAIIEGILIAFL
jgi:stage II sporulation protein M